MPTEIFDWNDLDAVRNDITADYKLVNDLDKDTTGYGDHASASANGGDGWEPIGDSDNRFDGTFDGQGHEIANLVSDRPDENYVGLFGWTGGAVESVGMVEVNVSGDNRVGGLAGLVNGAEIMSSYATGTVTGGREFAGGLVGQNQGNISDSYATANVSGKFRVGGLVGINSNAVSDSYALSDTVEGDNQVGGLVGATSSGNSDLGISRCYAAVETVTANSDVGAFCGQLGESAGKSSTIAGYIYDSYVDIALSNQSDAIGNRLGVGEDDVDEKQTAEMQGDSPTSEMNEFDFSATWETVLSGDENTADDGYPILRDVSRQTQLESQGLYQTLSPPDPPSNLNAGLQ